MIEQLAVAGATGAVGQIIRQLLDERNFPAERLKFLASERSVGTTVEYRGQPHPVELLCPDAFEGVDLCIASTPDDVARDFIPEAVKRGTTVIDESGAWRMAEHVPLVVPEVNAEVALTHQGIIASPSSPRRCQYLPGNQRSRRCRATRTRAGESRCVGR